MTGQLLRCGANITEMNTIRKHLSGVKGGRFAEACGKASIFQIVLSDVIGDKLDVIASGPAYPDASTSEEALAIIKKYRLKASSRMLECIAKETPKEIANCETSITGSVEELCEAASKAAEKRGYRPLVLTSTLDCEAKAAGEWLSAMAREIKGMSGTDHVLKPCAIIAGGETVVHLTGSGKGGRNQEIALSAAIGIEGLEDVLVFSVGSDGTDGPTDAAGGIVDGASATRMRTHGFKPEAFLANNDAYHALELADGLVITGPTGTNVNDVMVLLCK